MHSVLREAPTQWESMKLRTVIGLVLFQVGLFGNHRIARFVLWRDVYHCEDPARFEDPVCLSQNPVPALQGSLVEDVHHRDEIEGIPGEGRLFRIRVYKCCVNVGDGLDCGGGVLFRMVLVDSLLVVSAARVIMFCLVAVIEDLFDH